MPSLLTMPYVINGNIPLTRIDPATGATLSVLCVRIDGALHFHPQRMREVLAELRERDRAFARWADDGGAA